MADVFEELREVALRFRDEREWERFHSPKNLAMGLSVEAAELCELFLWKTAEESREALVDEGFRERLAHELADVQVFLLYLAHAADISIPDAVREKLRINAEKYPVEKSRGVAKKYDEL